MRHGAAAVAAAALAGGLLVAVPSTASAATPLPIATIQGTGRFSPYVGKNVTTTPSVVTAAYPTGGLNGFVIQTPGTGGKKRSLKKASDAVFVFTGKAGFDVKVGDLVTVSGTVEEYPDSTDPDADSLTEIGGKVSVTKSDASYKKVQPVSGVSWASTYDRRENLESMLFSSTEKWTVNDTYDLGTFGALGLATGGRLVQPTDLAPYGSKAERKQADRNAERQVVLDDGQSTRFDSTTNRGTPPYITRSKDVRIGDTAKLAEPVVVDYRNGAWTLNPTRPTAAGDEVATLTRKSVEKVPNVKGDVSVASFNVLNYFTTLGKANASCKANPVSSDGTPNTVASGCDQRGAWDSADLGRQQDKIVDAINQLDSSVTGLMEIENSAKLGETADEATKTLVGALNKAAGRAKWDYVPSSDQLQPVADQDVITNAIIFQPAEVTWAGKAYADGKDATDEGAFSNARTPIAAKFTPVGGGAPMLVVVNHFKSKGSAPSDPADPNADQGQGAWNAARVAQSNALLAWLPGVQADARTDAVAMVGDFNSYTREDPLETLYDAGWSNAGSQKDYSYNFDGLSGSLDHVLLNPAAKKRLTGSGVWNINSIEPIVREYSRYKSTAVDFFLDSNPYRASDHDPVKVGLKRGKASEVTLTLLNFNDFHGRISGASPSTVQFFGAVEQQRAAGGEDKTLLLSAGDSVGASLFASSVQQDQPTIDVLNAADLDVSAVGNHEFDRGFADLDGRIRKAADWTYLGANVYEKGTTKPALPSYAIVDRGGLKVGVVGAVTQETSTLVSPAGISGVEFGDPVEAVNRVTKQLTDGKKSNGEADVVVAEYHEGAALAGLGTKGEALASLADQEAASPVFTHIVNDTSPKVAAIFTAHTHQRYVYDAPVPGVAGATRPVTQSGSYAQYLAKVTLTVDLKTKKVLAHTQSDIDTYTTTPSNDELIASYPRVRRIANIVDAALDRADELGSVKIGEATHELTRAFVGATDSRAKESTLSDLVAEMYRSSTSSPERGSAQIGVQNPGGVRTDLDEGDITFGEAASVLPFANSLFTVDLTGAQFKTLLEQQWQRDASGNVPTRPYLQLGLSKNVTYSYDESLAEGSRITSITVDGKAIDPAATYRVATNSFLAAGGDNFRVFAEGKNSKDTGLSDLDSWTDYIKAQTPVSPSFAKQAVQVSPLPSTLTAGQTTTFTLSSFDFTSRPGADGAYTGTDPTTTAFTATLNGAEVGTFTASEGSATIALAVPADAAQGAGTLVLEGSTGTTVTIPVTVG
ncbi:5'-nucleotidase [Microlunatus sagamiharensis]|uniref:5'-nucleotidase n=1 Tax=Microlunatus sagamiharensis TaxID=546874 RepID=A0A1H2LG01_9ACTN|nr:ExeM/NucH family extracellular endonuclease [Microlunatus sagamiharensis]SDU79947.1 5'-nucleotidase [Microlunatus sagamiharensis]